MAQLTTYALFTAEVIALSGSSTSGAIDIRRMNAAALHLTAISGTSPDVTFTYTLCSTQDGTFIAPQNPSTIGANKSLTDVMDFVPEAAKYMKIVATNNNAAQPVTITCKLAIQENWNN